MSTTHSGADLEAVLNVRRRTLASIGETTLPRQLRLYTDTIYLKREDPSNDLLSLHSNIVIFGELQFLCSIFERYTSNIDIYEETAADTHSSPPASHKPSVSTTQEDEEEDEGPPVVSTLRKTSITASKGSSSPPGAPGSPHRRKNLGLLGRANTAGVTLSDFSSPSLEGKRYGCIQLPSMNVIEVLEILFRTGLELVDVLSDHDKNNVLHQNFVFSKNRQPLQKVAQSNSRTTSFSGT